MIGELLSDKLLMTDHRTIERIAAIRLRSPHLTFSQAARMAGEKGVEDPPKPKKKGEEDRTTKREKKPAPSNDPDDDGTGENENDDVKPVRPTKKGEKPKKEKAAAEFNAAVRAKMAQGMTSQRATAAVARERPQLRERLVAAFNTTDSRPRVKTSAAPTSDAHEELQTLQAKWDRLIAAQMERGLTRSRAVAAVAQSHPNLRRNLCEAASAAQRMR